MKIGWAIFMCIFIVKKIMGATGRIAPYPVGIIHTLFFSIVFLILLVVSFILVKKRANIGPFIRFHD